MFSLKGFCVTFAKGIGEAREDQRAQKKARDALKRSNTLNLPRWL